MTRLTIPEALRGKCKLYVNGVGYELPAEVASIEVCPPAKIERAGAHGGGGHANQSVTAGGHNPITAGGPGGLK